MCFKIVLWYGTELKEQTLSDQCGVNAIKTCLFFMWEVGYIWKIYVYYLLQKFGV